MARVHESIGAELADWIAEQLMFFVGTAPLAGDGHGAALGDRGRRRRIADACGYGVPRMDLGGERDHLVTWADAKGSEGLTEYRATRNVTSVDRLPGVG